MSPPELATWIALCVPWAEPQLAAALVMAGSNGRPHLVVMTDQSESDLPISTQIRRLASADLKSLAFIGATQLPANKLAMLGIDPTLGLDTCTNLQLGYQGLADAYEAAGKNQRSPWPRLTLAFKVFRGEPANAASAYAERAVEYLKTQRLPPPLPMTDPRYHAILADWAAGQARRLGPPRNASAVGVLTESHQIAVWARTKS